MKDFNVDKVIAAFCGTGKTYMLKNSSTSCNELECWNYRNGDFPYNYVKEVLEMIGKTQYLFISTDPVILKELNKRGIKILLIYPKNELRNEYLDRFIQRDSPPDFIGAVMKYWHTWIDELKEQNYCEHRILESGEYLQNVLSE